MEQKDDGDLKLIIEFLNNATSSRTEREIRSFLGSVSRPTMTRRLNALINAGLVESVGSGRSTKYQSVRRFPMRIRVPVGLYAEDIEAYVSLSPELRVPIGYQRSFLDKYEPNATQYLPDVILRRLHDCGRLKEGTTYHSDNEESLRVIQRFLIDLSHASSSLEGIHTDYLITERLVLLGAEAITEKDVKAVRMIINHKDAIESLLSYLSKQTDPSPMGFNRYTITNIHANLTKGLIPDPSSVGQVRRRAVRIQGSAYQPIDFPSEIESTLDQVLETCEQIKDPFEQSFFALVHLSYLQPFEDGNKRTSRVMANLPLMKANLCPISFLGTSDQAYIAGVLGVYEMNRTELLRDVYVSTYTQNSSLFHGERDRATTPDRLSLQYHRQISRAVRDMVESNPHDPLTWIDERVSAIARLDDSQKSKLKDIVLEDCRDLNQSMSSVLGIDSGKYKAWERDRITYADSIEIPSRLAE